MKKLFAFLVLPSEITDFERQYLERVNRVALAFFALHVPVFMVVAWLNGTRPLVAGALSLAVVVGPAIAQAALRNPRTVSVVHGVTAMFMGGLLVHFGQGPVQIEMHFYFFALIAMCAVFGNPLVIIAAAVTVALHHLILWLVLPRSVFNYEAEWWVVGVHAAFVVLESVATCFISRSFFDNVIGLERIVHARTAALDAKNRDMRLLLDSVEQGFLTIDRSGMPAAERSAPIARWFGGPARRTWFDMLDAAAPGTGARSRLAWDEVIGEVMPLELTLAQMPARFARDGLEWRVEYRPIGGEGFEQCLVIVTDVTAEVRHEAAERERREAMAVFERVLQDRSGFETFFEEGANIVDALARGTQADLVVVRRLLHTLKGNAAIFGLPSVADLCHAIEDFIAEQDRHPPSSAYGPLLERWRRLATDVDKLLGTRARVIEMDEIQYDGLLAAVKAGEPKATLLRKLKELRYEPTAKRLRHFADQARRIAHRLDKGELEVAVEDHGVRLDAAKWGPFWSAFVHAIRNALDHGIESPDARVAAGKPPNGHLRLATSEEHDRVVVEIADDGSGIDWEAVGRRAAREGLPAATREEMEQALFAYGVSTASNVTDLSGRGIGMGALLQGTRALGGSLTVESVAGKGTLVRMSFPMSSNVSNPKIPVARTA